MNFWSPRFIKEIQVVSYLHQVVIKEILPLVCVIFSFDYFLRTSPPSNQDGASNCEKVDQLCFTVVIYIAKLFIINIFL